MTTFLGPDEATNVDLADSPSSRRDQGPRRVFSLHLRDLVYYTYTLRRRRRAPLSFVQTLEAKVIAEKAASERKD